MSNATPSASNSPPPRKAQGEPYVQQTDGSFRAVKLLPRRARDSVSSTLDGVCWAAPLSECATAVPEYEHRPPAPVQRGGQKFEWVATTVPLQQGPVPGYVPRPVEQDAPPQEEEYYSDDDEVHERHPGQQLSSPSKNERESSPAAAPVSASRSTSAAPTAPRHELVLDEDYDAVQPQDDPMDMDSDCVQIGGSRS